MAKKDDPTFEERQALQDKILAGELGIGAAIRALRKQIHLTQPAYAKIAGVFPRVLMSIENDQGNPTLDTLNKVLDKFGYEIGIVKKKKKPANVPRARASDTSRQ